MENKDALLILQKAGISKTSKRLAVLCILLEATTPLCANTIRQLLKSKASVDKVTIYRILSLFKQHKIIREIASSGGVSFFELINVKNPVHPHFNCISCGTFTCLSPIPLTEAQQSILSGKDYHIEHIDINISGVCSDCRTAEKTDFEKRYHAHERKLCIQKR